MKPCVLILLFAATAAAQTIGTQVDAELAKQQAAVAAVAADVAAVKKALPPELSGVRELSEPIVLPRQTLKVPPPFMASGMISPAGELGGVSPTQTILRFAPTIKGPLVASEGFGDAKLGAWWNDGAAFTCFVPRVHDLAIDGRGELHPHPYVNAMGGQPDKTGPDAVPRGDGVCLAGTGAIAERLRLFQVQGTALVVCGAPIAGQSGQFGLYDEAVARVDDINVLQCINGIDCSAGDARISRVSISQVAKDGLTVSGPGTYITDAHVWGADRSVVFGCEVHVSAIYAEAARIGLHVLPGAWNSTIDGLNIGPSTCSSRGALIEATCVDVTGLTGTISGASAVGCELAANTAEIRVSGHCHAYNGATACVVRGHRHTIRINSEVAGANSTAVKVIGPVTNCVIELTGWGEANTTALDLSQAELGGGNEFRVRFSGAARRVIYPGDKNKLPAGNKLAIDGVEQ